LAINFWALLQAKNENRRWRDKYFISYRAAFLGACLFHFSGSVCSCFVAETLV